MSGKRLFSLVFVRENKRILLGMKKRGFGKGKWNGFGGKVEPNESIEDAAIRELHEECGLIVNSNQILNVGRLEFTFEDEPGLMDVVVFMSNHYKGIPVESEEMIPRWFDIDNIPFDQMWLDDKIWFPKLLAGIIFHGKFHYRGYDQILSYDLKELHFKKMS